MTSEQEGDVTMLEDASAFMCFSQGNLFQIITWLFN